MWPMARPRLIRRAPVLALAAAGAGLLTMSVQGIAAVDADLAAAQREAAPSLKQDCPKERDAPKPAQGRPQQAPPT